jgi:hypothetical protein
MDETTPGAYVDSIAGHDGSCPNTCPAPDANGAVYGSDAQTFNGSSTSILVPSASEFDWAAGDDFAIEAWINRGDNGFSGSEVILGRDDAVGTMKWSLGIDGSGQVVFRLTSSNNETVQLTSTKVLSYNSDAVWHHIVATKEGNTISLYMDSEDPIQQSFAFTGDFASLDAGISIGRLEASGGEQYFNGTIDEVAIYSQALSSERIRGHYFMARGYDRTVDDQIRIMPLGDSITADSAPEAARAQGDWFSGYRRPLWSDLTTNEFPVDFVGAEPYGDFAAPVFDYDNAAFPGITTAELYSEVLVNGYNPNALSDIPFGPTSYDTLGDIYPSYTQQRTGSYGTPYLADFPADIILLHIGTNGLTDSTITSNINSLRQILDHIDGIDERITVILARIINRGALQYPHQPTTDFNVEIANLAQQRIADGDKIIVVDQESALTYPDDMEDNLHPYMTGYNKMAAVWFTALDTFLPVAYTIEASANENGAIEPSGSVQVEQGDAQNFSFIPDVGYHVEEVLVDDVSIGAPALNRFDNVTSDHTIEVSFAINQYTIEFVSGSNGTVNGLLSQTVTHGAASGSVEAVPYSGYEFDGWSGDFSGADNPLVIQSITSDMTVQANFVEEYNPDPGKGSSSGGGGGCFIAIIGL